MGSHGAGNGESLPRDAALWSVIIKACKRVKRSELEHLLCAYFHFAQGFNLVGQLALDPMNL